jgi:hypothetical protein
LTQLNANQSRWGEIEVGIDRATLNMESHSNEDKDRGILPPGGGCFYQRKMVIGPGQGAFQMSKTPPRRTYLYTDWPVQRAHL